MATKKHRSPPYPGITLEDALERAKAFFKQEGRYEALVPTALTHWGYSTKSSGGLVTVAALKAYGLMGDKGGGAERKVYLTPVGLKIVMDERSVSPDRDKAIREAALAPKIMAELWAKYGADLPSRDTLRYFLRVEKEYTDSAANDVIKVYTANLKFAGLDGASDEEAGQAGENENEDAIDDGGQDLTGNPGPNASRQSSLPPLVITPPPAVTTARAVAGEEIGNYRVSKSTTIRLLASGPYSRSSIESLVKQLQLGLDLGNFDDLPGEEDPFA